MDKKIGSIPNSFYDLIVFASSTALFASGIFFGLGQQYLCWYKQFGTGNIVLILAGLLFLSYEYGRIAEAWSSAIVQRPLKFIRDHSKFLLNKDFLASLDDVETALGFDENSKLRSGGKWAVYFYAIAINPRIGTDLLKRYAWEKLARNSAFTFCILSTISIVIGILGSLFNIEFSFKGNWIFGSSEYTITVLLLTFITYAEYYKRNCWNNDLLQRIVPVLSQIAIISKQSNIEGE